MVRKKREDYLREKQARERADSITSGRGGLSAFGQHSRYIQSSLRQAEDQRLADLAAENEGRLVQHGPIKAPNVQYPLLIICLLVLAYLILIELGLA